MQQFQQIQCSPFDSGQPQWCSRSRSLCCQALVGLLICLTPQTGWSEDEQRYEYLQIRMGIPVRIVLYAASEETANQASKAAYDRLRELDRMLSDYDPDSELMQLCRTAVVDAPQPVSPELFTILTAAREISERTDGAFDVTVGPVVRLWRIARRRKTLPDPTRLQEALTRVGYQSVQLDPQQQTVQLTRPNMLLDLGGIAKGYAADQALAVLAKQGITRALVDASGDIVVGDPPVGREYWSIEVERLQRSPLSQSAAHSEPVEQKHSFLNLRNAAVATSGDAYQYLEINGVRYSHLIDPRTGLGLTTPSSVTVIAPTGQQADALASAISVLGPHKGLELIKCMPTVEAYIVLLDEQQQPQEFSSPGFDQYLQQDQASQRSMPPVE